ncbi:hypothetical protein [Nocardioides sp.]|uniref:hypothetical protein n=1 Tax=Nocardioides sp. TaxID=35761 RepID=UPI003518CEEB
MIDPSRTIGPIPIPKRLWFSMNDRLYWADRHRRTRALRELGGWHARAAGLGGALLGPTAVTARISYPTNTRADPTNASPVIKALVDGAVDVGVWIDDDDKHVVNQSFVRGPKTGTPGIYAVRLDLTPWPPPEQVHP